MAMFAARLRGSWAARPRVVWVWSVSGGVDDMEFVSSAFAGRRRY